MDRRVKCIIQPWNRGGGERSEGGGGEGEEAKEEEEGERYNYVIFITKTRVHNPR